MISGIICLEARKINPNDRNKEVKGALSLSRVDPRVSDGSDRGEAMSSVDLTRPAMKVLRLYPGTILALDQPAFQVGTALDPRYATVLFPGVVPPAGDNYNDGFGGGGGGIPTLGGLASVSRDSQDSQGAGDHSNPSAEIKLPNIHHLSQDQIQEAERERRRAQVQFERDCVPAYKLQMVFESSCTYLSIPRKLFKSSLKDLPTDAAADIKLQLRTSHSLAHDRIMRLGPWIRGDSGVGQTLQLDLDDDVYNEEQTFRSEEAAAKAPVADEGEGLDMTGTEGGGFEGYKEPTPEELVKSITLSFAAPSMSPKKKGGQSKFQMEKREMAVSKSTGSLPNTRGILMVGSGTLDNGRGRNKIGHDILKEKMTLKQPLDGTYGEAYMKLAAKQKDLPPVTPVTKIVQELAKASSGQGSPAEA